LRIRVVTVILDKGDTDKQVIEHLYQAVRGQTGPVPRWVRKAEMIAHLRSDLAGKDVVLMVDEAQNASLRALDLVRQLHEHPTSRSGLVVAGMELREKLAREEMLNNRVGLRVEFQPLTDTKLVATLHAMHPTFAAMSPALIQAVDDEHCHGQLRCWATFLEWILAMPGSFTGVTGVAPRSTGGVFDHGFRSVSRVEGRLSRRWRRLPRAGYCVPGRRDGRGRGQIGIGSALIVCQAAVRSGVQGQSAGRCSQVLRCP
jgi:hypothetical protein